MKTLYVSDMDGTLLGSDSRVSSRSAEMLSELCAAGAMFTVATARTAATVRPLLAGIDMNLPAIVMTGAARWDFSNEKYRDVQFMPEKSLSEASESCAAFGVFPFIYAMDPDMKSLDVFHKAAEMSKTERGFYLDRAHLKRFHLASDVTGQFRSRTVLMFATGPEDAVCAAANALRETGRFSVYCYPDIFKEGIANLEVFSEGISKAAAIIRLRDELGAERLVVFGDNLNDLPMLGIADVAVAVGNALPAVKEAADTVIEPNYTDAVARFIYQDFYKQK